MFMLLTLAGCSGESFLLPGRGTRYPLPSTAPAFAPATIRVHPLTHLEPASGDVPRDKCLVILHVEFRDEAGDPIKALGSLLVELYRPEGGASPGLETRSISWDLSALSDVAVNASRFDPATQTYRLPLIADRWVLAFVGKDGPLPPDSPGYLRLRAVLSVREGATTRVLSDEYLLR